MVENKLLVGKGLLSPIQKRFLNLFSRLEDKDQFYLAGGTALSEYYLGHRLSFDLDFFTSVDNLVLPFSYRIEDLAKENDLNLSVVRRFATYVEFLVSDQQDALRVDMALDSPFRFAPAVPTIDGIQVNDYDDLCTDKLLAYYGRAEPRDAIDLFFILQNEPVDRLLMQASQKDTGFDLYWMAIALNQCKNFPDELERWPVKMLVSFEPVELKRQFQHLAQDLLANLK